VAYLLASSSPGDAADPARERNLPLAAAIECRSREFGALGLSGTTPMSKVWPAARLTEIVGPSSYVGARARSNLSAFITLVQAATKSFANFSRASLQA